MHVATGVTLNPDSILITGKNWSYKLKYRGIKELIFYVTKWGVRVKINGCIVKFSEKEKAFQLIEKLKQKVQSNGMKVEEKRIEYHIT